MTQARRALKRFVNGLQPDELVTGTVVRTSGETCDVEPANGGPVMYNVRIKPAVNGAEFGVLAFPKKGSTCIIGQLDGNENKYVLIQAEQLDRVLLKTSNGSNVELRGDGTLVLNGDDFGSLIKVHELRNELNKVNTILKAIQQVFTTWAPVDGNSGVASLKAAVNAFTNLPRPTYQTIENSNVKHGGA